MLTELGCHPVGIKPVTSGFLRRRLMTATALVPPLVTYAVLSSGERLMLFGLLPFGMFLRWPRVPAGALVFTSLTILFEAVSIVTSESALATTTYSLLCARFRTILAGLPSTAMRDASVSLPFERFTTSTSRSRVLE